MSRKVLSSLTVITLYLSSCALGQDSISGSPKPETRALRDPFTLRLRVDKDHYYEEHYDKRIPYVSDNDVYLFSDENFGVNLTRKGDKDIEVSYQADPKKADVWLIFAQPKDLGVGMMLTIKNNLNEKLQIDALMTVPGKQGIYKTSILPIEAGLSDFESWPHPIVQLVLRNFRLSESQERKTKP